MAAVPAVYNQIARHIFGAEAFLNCASMKSGVHSHYHAVVISILHRAWDRLRSRDIRAQKDVNLAKKALETSKQGECWPVGLEMEDEQPVVAVAVAVGEGVRANAQSQGGSLKRPTAPGDNLISGMRKRHKGRGVGVQTTESCSDWEVDPSPMASQPSEVKAKKGTGAVVPGGPPGVKSTRSHGQRAGTGRDGAWGMQTQEPLGPQTRPETHPLTQHTNQLGSTVKMLPKSQWDILSDSSDNDSASIPSLLSVVDGNDDSISLDTTEMVLEGEAELGSECENEVETAEEDTHLPADAERVPRAGKGRGSPQTARSFSDDKATKGEGGGSCSSARGDEPEVKRRTSRIIQWMDETGEAVQPLVPGRKLFIHSEANEERETRRLSLLASVGFMFVDESEMRRAFEVWTVAHRHFPVMLANLTRGWPFPPYSTVSRWLKHKWPDITQSEYNQLMLSVLDEEPMCRVACAISDEAEFPGGHI